MQLRRFAIVGVFALAITSLCAQTVAAAPFVYSGTTVGDPTWNRPFTLGQLSGVGTNVPYDVFAFTVDTDTTAVFHSAPTTAGYDNFLLLYGGSFNPLTPLVNVLALNDDFSGIGVDSQFTHGPLTAGTPYFLVTTGFDNGDFGEFTNTITPREGNIVPADAAVPEPASLTLLGLGLAGIGARRWRQRKAS